jgi:hypothetical protein
MPRPVPDDDIVLLMDAYDVLVFPALANAAKVLADSPSPLLFCAERGVYPEFAGQFRIVLVAGTGAFYCRDNALFAANGSVILFDALVM